MATEENILPADRDEVYRAFFDDMQRQYLRSVVTDELIEEHRQNPLGQHSEPLERLLIFFRHRPLAGRYAIRRDVESGGYRLVVLSGQRGVAPESVNGELYDSLDGAYHAVFLKRLDELMQT